MVAFAPALFALVALANIAVGQQCDGNVSMCPGNTDGVSQSYLQCNSWSHQYVSQNCPTGYVCYANPKKPTTVMCGLPGTGGVPDQGKCTGNTAKCVASGQTGAYYQCNRWSEQYQNANCPNGLKCYNNASNTGVFCQ
ncbi:hypothetical protein GGH12_002307 [Coemansia sp. RSA 1822]|nr:hypothetical protein LPJ76_000289 [Coemansia sp. RSA 638]KAJ2124497.1 hypothetical protein IW147_001666 [Coemansia sp. RSA 720]KAJ2544541.1 hypothetical protein GGF49_001165 [Coemansia sp. RSA 1853]KAJ2563903.1 hypothetical protein GGH12_002307 [Coemansia sp. RSA 1822]KAJ2665248.1 hypothetical protein IW148_001720 [Coemansia sp. RSA 1199]